MATQQKLTRGISSDFAGAFTKSKLSNFYQQNKDKLLIGVRNNYLNIYYNCDSIAKIEYKKPRGEKKKRIVCEIDKYYLDGKHYDSKSKDKRFRVDIDQLIEDFDTIQTNSNGKKNIFVEKKVQSKLVILNNGNPNSKWYCLDIEWKKAFASQIEKDDAKFNGRFDIIAISREKPHIVAYIELKYGSGAIGGRSGVNKHIHDFHTFKVNNYFDSMKEEIVEIVKSQINLGIAVPIALHDIKSNNITNYEFYIITLNNTESDSKRTPKQTMAAYLFKKKRWGCKQLSTKAKVEDTFGDVTDKENEKIHVNFLFSDQEIKNLAITDIINHKDYDWK